MELLDIYLKKLNLLMERGRKVRFFKYKGVNKEDKIIREHDNLTETFINGRWMSDPSLITKINGTAHDETVVEITEKEAMTIIGIPITNKKINIITYVVPIIFIILLIILGSFAIKRLKDSYKEKNAINEKSLTERINEVIKVKDGEEDVTKDISQDIIKDLYNLIPFSASSLKNAYQSESTNINMIDSINLYATAITHCNNKNDCLVSGEGSYSIEDIKTAISHIFNGYNGYNVLSTPETFVSLDNKLKCDLEESKTSYYCHKNDSLENTYRDYDIVKITKEEDDMILYESSILVYKEYEFENVNYYTVYRYSNASIPIISCNIDNPCEKIKNPYATYGKSSIIYKHIFKKDLSGNYYWYSTEVNGVL